MHIHTCTCISAHTQDPYRDRPVKDPYRDRTVKDSYGDRTVNDSYRAFA